MNHNQADEEDRSTCFIITAIGEVGSPERLTADAHYKIYSKAVEMVGMRPVRLDLLHPDDFSSGGVMKSHLQAELWRRLRSARMAIADMTHPNVNASYEVGVRHGLQMPVLITTTDVASLPFDFRDYQAFEMPGAKELENAQTRVATIRKLAKRLRSPIQEIRSGVARGQQFRIVQPSFTGDVNESFYDAFLHAIRSVRERMLVVGSGFDADSPMASPVCRTMSGVAMRAECLRVECADETMQDWWKMLAQRLLPMPNFRLFAPVNKQSALLRDVALFDWDNEEHALVELMFHTPRRIDDGLDSKDVERAGYGCFAYSQKLADDIWTLVTGMRKSGELVELRTADDIAEHFGWPKDWADDEPSSGDDYAYYFAYGSNMLRDQMANRCSDFEDLGPAYLAEYEQTFSIAGTIWPGAVANVEPATDKKVHGVLYRVSQKDLRALDFFEGVQDEEYTRRSVRVFHEDSLKEATIYLNPRPSELTTLPAAAYVDRMIDGAIEHDLPAPCLDALKDVKKALIEETSSQA